MGRLTASIAALSAASVLTGAAVAPSPVLAKDIVINMAAPDWLPTALCRRSSTAATRPNPATT